MFGHLTRLGKSPKPLSFPSPKPNIPPTTSLLIPPMSTRAIIFSCARTTLYTISRKPNFLNPLITLSPLKNPISASPFPHFPASFLRLDYVGPVCSRGYHDGRPRGPLWRGKKLIGKEALFVVVGLKRLKEDDEKFGKFVKTHVVRLLKMDLIAVLTELERQEEVTLAIKVFEVIQKQDWYKPDPFLYKDLIITLARSRRMEDAMKLWDSMKKENIFPDCQTYTELIRGFLREGSPGDAMNIYENMKHSPDPPEELPFRILLKGLLPHPLLRSKVKQDFAEIFPDQGVYDPPQEIFVLR